MGCGGGGWTIVDRCSYGQVFPDLSAVGIPENPLARWRRIGYCHPMTVTTLSYERLEEDVLRLPRGDRSKLANRLLESLDDDEFQLSPEWRDELQRRIGEIDAGKANLIPAEDLWKEVNQRFDTTF